MAECRAVSSLDAQWKSSCRTQRCVPSQHTCHLCDVKVLTSPVCRKYPCHPAPRRRLQLRSRGVRRLCPQQQLGRTLAGCQELSGRHTRGSELAHDADVHLLFSREHLWVILPARIDQDIRSARFDTCAPGNVRHQERLTTWRCYAAARVLSRWDTPTPKMKLSCMQSTNIAAFIAAKWRYVLAHTGTSKHARSDAQALANA